jgi:hypothetical protein
MRVVSAKEGREVPRAGREGPSGARLPDGTMLGRRDLARRLGDFTRWKEHDAYREALERLLRDLKVEASAAADG